VCKTQILPRLSTLVFIIIIVRWKENNQENVSGMVVSKIWDNSFLFCLLFTLCLILEIWYKNTRSNELLH